MKIKVITKPDKHFKNTIKTLVINLKAEHTFKLSEETVRIIREKIAEGIKKIYKEKTGPDVKITVREVKEIKGDPKSGKPAPIVVSHVKPDEGYKHLT